jgi:type I restriction enzyme S subunit
MEVNPGAGRLRDLEPGCAVSFVPMEAVGEYGGLRLESTRAAFEADAGYTPFQDGDVLVARITPCFENGKGALVRGLVNGAGLGSTELHVLRAGPLLEPGYLLYLTLSHAFRQQGTRAMKGAGGQGRVSADFCRDFPIPLPPLAEQRAIAAFLDGRMAAFDRMIGGQAARHARLGELHSTLVSRALAEGLPPEHAGVQPPAPARSAGEAVLGEIPAHWAAERLKFSLRRMEQGWSPLCDSHPAQDGEWGVLKVGAVNGGRFDPRENKVLPPSDAPQEQYEIRRGDLLVSRANTPELLGSAALVGRVRPRLLLCDKLYRLHLREDRLLPQMLLHILRSRPARSQLAQQATGTSASMQNIDQDALRNLWIALPPLDEQRAIAKRLSCHTSRIDRAREKIEAAIERLREYRTALITAAVTGQIDVRGESEQTVDGFCLDHDPARWSSGLRPMAEPATA